MGGSGCPTETKQALAVPGAALVGWVSAQALRFARWAPPALQQTVTTVVAKDSSI